MARRGRFKDKAPAEIVDYSMDWEDRLSTGDTIFGTPVWTITGSDSSLTNYNQSNTSTVTTIVLSGGTLGVTYAIKCAIATVGGKAFEQTALLGVSTR